MGGKAAIASSLTEMTAYKAVVATRGAKEMHDGQIPRLGKNGPRLIRVRLERTR